MRAAPESKPAASNSNGPANPVHVTLTPGVRGPVLIKLLDQDRNPAPEARCRFVRKKDEIYSADEEGIVYAPRNFNVRKTAEIENLIRNAREQSGMQGGEVYITIKAIVKNWKEVDGVWIRVLKEISWSIEIRLPGSDKRIPLVTQERYFLKAPAAAPKLFANYIPENAKGLAAFAAPIIIQEFIHKPAVERRVIDGVKERGYVSVDAPGGQGLLYDLGAWLLDPFQGAEFAIGKDKRFDVTVWRDRLRKAANAKKNGRKNEHRLGRRHLQPGGIVP